jgi:hypothetical protein
MTISYRATETSKKSITDFPWINSNSYLGEIGTRNDREITRLLENTHYPHIVKTLQLIDKYGPNSQEIGESLLVCNDSFVLKRLLAELQLFAHLFDNNGDRVKPIRRIEKTKTPDFLVKLDDLDFLIELYSPIDYYGFQLFINDISSIIKNVDVDFGFKIEIDLSPNNFSFAYDFPEFRQILSWIKDFKKEFNKLLKNTKAGSEFSFKTPAESVILKIRVAEKISNQDVRSISFSQGTRSTDTIQYFRITDPLEFERTQWGYKIKDKLSQQQAGPPKEKTIRILAINLTLADTSDLGFINEPNIQENYTNHLIHIANRFEQESPYDIVVFCEISFRCGFSKPVILAGYKMAKIQEYFRRIGLQSPIEPIPVATKEETQRLMKEMIEYANKKDQKGNK